MDNLWTTVCTRRWARGRALTLAAVLGVAAVVAVADPPTPPAPGSAVGLARAPGPLSAR